MVTRKKDSLPAIKDSQVVGLYLRLNRSEGNFNYWTFPANSSISQYPFYVFIQVGEHWVGPVEKNLGNGEKHYIPLPLQKGQIFRIFIYDTVLHNYMQAK